MGERRGGFVRAGFRRAGTGASSSGGNIADQTLLGNNTGAPGPAIALTAAQVRTLLSLAAIATSGSASDIGSGTLAAARIADASLALAKLANIPDQTILGNNIGVAGPPIALTAAQLKAILGITTIVTSLNGAAGAATLASAGGTVAITGAAPALNLEARNIQTVANVAALAALAAGTLPDGSLVFVQTYKAYFELVASAQAAVADVLVAASGNAGHLWERVLESPDWTGQLAWGVDPVAGNNENAGTVASPVKTLGEIARRWKNAVLQAQAYTITITSDTASTDINTWSFDFVPGGTLQLIGTPTLLYTGTVTTWTARTAAPSATTDTIQDTTIPVSFTASGLMATGVRFRRTNGTAAYWYGMKDLGAQTLRINRPCNVSGTAALTLANNDTYVAEQLTKIFAQRWNVPNNIASSSIGYLHLDDQGSVHEDIQYTLCSFSPPGSTSGFFAGSYNGCCWFQAAALAQKKRGTVASVQFSACRGTGATLWRWNGVQPARVNEFFLQGAELRFDQSLGEVTTGVVTVCDNTTQGVQTTFGAIVTFIGGAALSGLGNSGKLLLTTSGGQILYDAATLATGASTSAGSPYQAGLKTSTTLPLTLQDDGAGIYETQTAAPLPFLTTVTVPPALLKFSGTHLGGAAGVHDTFLADEGAMTTVVELTASPAYPMPARTAQNLRVNPRSNTLATAASVTLMKNGVATAMTVNIPAGSTALVTDLVDTVAFAANDTLDLRVETTAAGAGNALTVSAVLEIK
jgi:hypothetical protein